MGAISHGKTMSYFIQSQPCDLLGWSGAGRNKHKNKESDHNALESLCY